MYFLLLYSTYCLEIVAQIVYYYLVYVANNIFRACFTVGDSSNQVHMEGYSVSSQCMALVRDDCLVPTKDAPELGYVRESSSKQYVPDVFYKVSVFHLLSK